MAKIRLSNKSFVLLPEGSYVVQITKSEYKQPLNIIKLTITTHDGKSMTEKFDLSNDGALAAFSIWAQKALDCAPDADIDPESLEGKFLKVEVEHKEYDSKTKPGTKVTFAHVLQTEHADGWEKDDGTIDVGEEDEPTAVDDVINDALK